MHAVLCSCSLFSYHPRKLQIMKKNMHTNKKQTDKMISVSGRYFKCVLTFCEATYNYDPPPNSSCRNTRENKNYTLIYTKDK